MLCATILRHVAQTTDVFAERRKMDPNRSCKRVQYLAKTYALCNHFTACSPNYRRFRRKAKNGPKSFMQTSPIFSKNVCFVQPFYGMWTKPQTFSQNGENWTEIDLCEWVLFFAKTDALCNHFTACGPNYRLFRIKAKNGLQLIYSNESNI